MNKKQFLKKLNESDIRSVARLITLIENEDEIAEENADEASESEAAE